MERICVYPGSFDPITIGHMDVVRRACALFDRVIVAVLHNPAKRGCFPVEERMGLKHVRIAGAADVPCTEISGMFGAPGGVAEELRSEQCQILLTGEACEWALGEYARDAAQLGHRKALIVMSHIGSERDGMRFVADRMTQVFPELEIRYFECGEVYTYSDDV